MFRISYGLALLFLAFVTESKHAARAQMPHTVLKCNSAVDSVSFSADGSTLAGGDASGKVTLWNTTDWKVRDTFQAHKGDIIDLEIIDKSGQLIVTNSNNRLLKLWNRNNKSVEEITTDAKRIYLSDCRRYLAVGNGTATVAIIHTGADSDNKLNGSKFGTLITKLAGIKTETCRFSPDSNYLAVGGLDQVQLLNIKTGENVTFEAPSETAPKFEVTSLSFSTNNLLAFGKYSGTLHVVDIKQRKQISVWPNKRPGGISSVVFHPDNKKVIAGGADGFIRIWGLSSNAPLKEIPAHDALVWQIAISQDGRWLASASDDKTVKVWDLNLLAK